MRHATASFHQLARPAGSVRAPSLTEAQMIHRCKNGDPELPGMDCRKMPSASIRLMRPAGTATSHR